MTKSFLKEEKRLELVNTLVKSGMSQEAANKLTLTDLPDDLAKVDLSITAHVLSISHFRKTKNETEAAKGLLILLAFTEEAMSRGLGENDFPMALQAIKNDLGERGIVSIQ